MTKFVVIHTSYEDVQIGLFSNKKLIAKIAQNYKQISKCFVLLFEQLLTENNLTLKDIDFIGVNKGPAPFTTLRVSLAFVNGLSFANQIPVIGINSLDLFTHENFNPECSNTLVMLNAFCNDIYYGFLNYKTKKYEEGCAQIEKYLLEIKIKIHDKIFIVGNGALLHKDLINNILGTQAIIDLDKSISLESIANQALIIWESSAPKNYNVLPLYLKNSL